MTLHQTFRFQNLEMPCQSSLIKVKEEMESILTEFERTELSRLLNKLVLGIENIEI
ncbi:MarR family transcriptional regulator [Streptococcus pneumoniae]|nr:MarR family transcriptional regulator [Streptococcus pneumoniae]